MCAHCGEKNTIGGSDTAKMSPYCSFCSTADKRKKIDEENARIRESLKLKA